MMSWQRPSPRVVWRAIETYLAVAYAPANAGKSGSAKPPEPAPSAVRARLETLKSTPQDAFYDSPVFERQEAPRGGVSDGTPQKYALRLGNRTYPHMKLIIERSPDGANYLLRADTHDTHIQPRPGSREQAAFAELMKENRTISEAVESAWEQLGLPTFKKFLRDDLERRRNQNA